MAVVKNCLMILFYSASCLIAKSQEFTTPAGMKYYVYSGNGTKQVMLGNIMKVDYTYKVKDSIYFTTAGRPLIYITALESTHPYDTSETKYDMSAVWTKLKVGDSVVAIQLADSFFKVNNPRFLDPQLKPGVKIITYAKIHDVFTSDSMAKVDEKMQEKLWLEKEKTEIKNYLKNKKIKFKETISGSIVQIVKQGSGKQIKSGDSILLRYTASTFSGIKYQSNIDSLANCFIRKPLALKVGNNKLILKAVEDAFILMRPGCIAKVYTPSLLAYGANGVGSSIKPYEKLVWHIEVSPEKKLE